MKIKFFLVALVLLATSSSCAASPTKRPKKSIFSRSRWDRRTEETTTIRVYQPKYKTLFNFRQLPTTSTFPPILPEGIDNYSTSPPTVAKIPRHPLLVEELFDDPLFPAATEPPATSLSDSSNLSAEFPNSVSSSSSSLNSTAQSSKPSSMFSMSNLLRPSNTMANFFKSFSRSPKSSASPSSTVKPNALSDPELPSSVMKPPSPITFPPINSDPLASLTSLSSSSPTSEMPVPSLSASFFNSPSPHVPIENVSPGFSESSPNFVPPRGTSIIVAASNPSDDTPPPRIPKSSPASVHAVSADSSVNGDYSFAYRVNDAATNQDFGHSENRVGNHTQGRYDVVLPDGRRQVVDYQVLNNSGYFADVSYVGDIIPNEPPIIQTTTPTPLLITNAKIEENLDFPI